MATNRVYRGQLVEQRRADRREQFLRAGIEVIGGVGYLATTVSAVCAAAGLSSRQFYEQFDNREDLLVAVYDQVHEDAVAAVTRASAELTGDVDRTAALTLLVEAYLGSVACDPARARIVHVEIIGVSEAVESRRRERRAQWVPVVEDAIRMIGGSSRRLPGGDGMAAQAIIGALNALGYEWCLSDPRPPTSEIVDVLLAMGLGLTSALR